MENIKKKFWKINRMGLFIPVQDEISKDRQVMLKNTNVYITTDILKSIDNNLKIINEEKIVENIKEFNQIKLLEILSRLNFIFAENKKINKEVELFFIKDLFPKQTSQEIIKHLNDGKKFFTRLQILTIMKLSLLYANNKNTKEVLDNLYSFGELLLMINDYLERDAKTSENLKEEFNKKIIGCAIRSYEFSRNQQFRYLIARYKLLFNKYSKKILDEKFNILKNYKESIGIDLNIFMFILISIYSFYENKKTKLIEFIKNPKNYFFYPEGYYKDFSEELKNQINKVLEIISADLKEFEDLLNKLKTKFGFSNFEYVCFKRKPLLRLANKSFLPIDLIFLQYKLTSGIYWELFDNLKNEEEKNNFSSYWGKVFEYYVVDIMKRCWKNKDRLFLAEDIDEGNEGQQVDSIIYYPESLIFIEITTKKINHVSLVSGDYDSIVNEMVDIMIGGKKSKKGKLIQLFNEIEKFKSGNLKLKGIIASDIKYFYPILLFENSFPILPIFDFKKEIKNRLKGNKNRYDKFIEKLQILDIEELEILEPLMKNGMSFKDLIDLKISIYENICFKNFLYAEKIKEIENDFLMNEFKDFWNNSMDLLRKYKT